MSATIYVTQNGKVLRESNLCISPNNRSFRYGDGCFETMKMINGQVLLSKYHFERLFSSLRLLKFEVPNYFTTDFLEEQILALAKKNGHSKLARVRLMVYRGDGGLYDPENHFPNCLIQTWGLNPANNKLNENGLVIDVFEGARKCYDDYSAIKSNNFLGYAMAALWAKEQHLNDAILLDAYRNVADATIANVFVIKDGAIKTPSLKDGGINGVMRRYLLEHLPQNGYEVAETGLPIEELLRADEVFLTNSIYGIRWVKQLKTTNYENKITALIYKKIIAGPLAN